MSINNQEKNPEEKEKPPFLYHGSRHGALEELEPMAKSIRDKDEGPVVFATPDLALATIFMTGEGKASGKFGDVSYVVINCSRDEFIKNDNGGHIYVLSSDTFQSDPNKGLGIYEWISNEKVKPLKKIEYPSTLDAMIDNNVQVYFVDEKTYEKIESSDDHGLSILLSLESENQKRGINVREFE